MITDPNAFKLYCFMCAKNTEGTLYSLIWIFLATNVELSQSLRLYKNECLRLRLDLKEAQDRIGVLNRRSDILKSKMATLLKHNEEMHRALK